MAPQQPQRRDWLLITLRIKWEQTQARGGRRDPALSLGNYLKGKLRSVHCWDQPEIGILGLRPQERKGAIRGLQVGNTASLGKPGTYMRMHEPSPHARRHVPEYMCQECMYTGVHVPDACTRCAYQRYLCVPERVGHCTMKSLARPCAPEPFAPVPEES